jgi:hypothetical protein
MPRRRLTHAEALDAWRVDGELRGGHRPSETIAFVSALQDVEDERSLTLPPGFVPGGGEPRWVTRLRLWFGR